MSRNAALVVVGLILASLTGCGGESKPEYPTTVAVKGKVTYQGKSLGGGNIRFEPDSAGKEASGSIQPDGTFTLSTYTDKDGAVLGTHRLAIRGNVKDGAAIPAKFHNFSSSQVEVEVTKDKNDYTIDLK